MAGNLYWNFKLHIYSVIQKMQTLNFFNKCFYLFIHIIYSERQNILWTYVKDYVQRMILQRQPYKRSNWRFNETYLKIVQRSLLVYSCKDLGILWDIRFVQSSLKSHSYCVTLYLTWKPSLYRTRNDQLNSFIAFQQL